VIRLSELSNEVLLNDEFTNPVRHSPDPSPVITRTLLSTSPVRCHPISKRENRWRLYTSHEKPTQANDCLRLIPAQKQKRQNVSTEHWERFRQRQSSTWSSRRSNARKRNRFLSLW
jgi:hypothetical protein